MKVVVVESPAKAKTINKYLGSDYKVVASYGHVRDLPAKDGSVLPDADFAMSWEVDGKSEKHMKAIVAGGARRRQPDPRHRPRPRGRGDLVARAGGAESAPRAQGCRRQAGRLQRGHQERRGRGVPPPARDRPRAGRRLSGAPRARLSGRLHLVAGAVAQTAGQPLGRPRAIGGAAPDLRARSRDRGVQIARILDGRGRRSRPRAGRPSPRG